MMKKFKVKKIAFTLMTFLSLLVVSCEVERDLIETENENYVIKKISFAEFKSKQLVFNKFKATTSSGAEGSQNRIIYDSLYKVYYDTDNIISIEKNGYTSYTIPVQQQEGSTGLDNLVLYENENTDLSAKMIHYSVTDLEIEKIRDGEYVDFTNKTSSKHFGSNSTESSYTNSWFDDSGCLVTATITYTAGTACGGIQQHSHGESCPHSGTPLAATPPKIVIKYSYAFCPPDGQTGGSAPNNTPNGNPAGGAGVPADSGANSNNSQTNPENSDNVVTSPTAPGMDLPDVKTPCIELKKFNTNNSIQQAMRILKGQSSGPAEHGNYISEFTNSVGGSGLSFPIIPQNPNNPIELDISAGLVTGKVKGVMHCHTNSATTKMIPMFSAADFGNLYNIAYNHVPANNAEKDYAEYTVMLSVGSGHYALKFTNFDGQYGTFNNNINQFKQELEKECRAITSIASAEQQQKTFLKYMNKFFAGTVGLFKATETTNANGVSNISGWSEQTLNEAGDIVPIDCQ